MIRRPPRSTLDRSSAASDVYKRQILSTTRWLNAPDDQKKVKIKTSKKIYSSGELVEFTAQVYDESFNPVSEAEVKVNINAQNSKDELILNSIGAGSVSYTHLRAHETVLDIVCRLLLEKKKKSKTK